MLRGNNGRGLKKGNRKGRKLIRCYLCGLLEPPSQGNSRRVCRIDPGQSQLRVREAGVFNHQVPTSHQLRAVSEDLNSQHPQCPAQELSTLLQPERGTQGSTLIASGSCQSPGSARPSLAPPWWGREGVPHHCWGRVKVQAAQGASIDTTGWGGPHYQLVQIEVLFPYLAFSDSIKTRRRRRGSLQP